MEDGPQPNGGSLMAVHSLPPVLEPRADMYGPPTTVATPQPMSMEAAWLAASRAFVTELQAFHESRGQDFKVPKFYGVEVDLLK